MAERCGRSASDLSSSSGQAGQLAFPRLETSTYDVCLKQLHPFLSQCWAFMDSQIGRHLWISPLRHVGGLGGVYGQRTISRGRKRSSQSINRKTATFLPPEERKIDLHPHRGHGRCSSRRFWTSENGSAAVFAWSAGPVPISGPVKDRLRPVPDRS